VLADRLAESDERVEAAAGQAAEEAVDQHGDVFEGEAVLEDRAGGFLERVGAPCLAAGGFEPFERRGLLVGQVLRRLEQRPARVLEALGGVLVTELAQLVPVRAADLVERLVGRCTTW
jgi:hypothetical protein